MLLTFSDTKRTLIHPFLFTNSANREYVRRVYTTAINFPCVISLGVIEGKVDHVETILDFRIPLNQLPLYSFVLNYFSFVHLKARIIFQNPKK